MLKPIKFILDKFSPRARKTGWLEYRTFKDWTKTAEIRARARCKGHLQLVSDYWNAEGGADNVAAYSGPLNTWG